jgi:hypothetical protein
VDRRVRLLDRFRKLPAARKLVELAFVLGDGVAPERLHDVDVFAAACAAPVEGYAEHVELFLQPTDADAEVEPPVRHPIHRRRFLRRVDGIALRHEDDSGSEPHGLRARREERERVERLEDSDFAGRGESSVFRVRILRCVRAVVEQHDVLGHPDRRDAALLARGPDRVHELGCCRGICERHENSDLHV